MRAEEAQLGADDQPPPRKRTKTLLPASCRELEATSLEKSDEYDEKRLDEEIDSHFQGRQIYIVQLIHGQFSSELMCRGFAVGF